ncbi:MAG: phage tail tape measure protein, partial [Candidatus Aminicenantes bacterium]|nr:phage tail tape measure protein [Candidatus Aminicenantes bacterium]
MEIKSLLVKISADVSELAKALNDSKSKLAETGKAFKTVGTALTAAVTVPLVGIGTAAIKAAMDATESENLFEVAMGEMAGAARAWSEDLRKQLGLNAYEVRKNVATFYSMFDAMGLGSKSSYELSTGLTKLAYDMASFYNLNPEEAFQKLRAGITGEIEPLKRLGIVVDEASVKTYAYTHGIAQMGSELTEQQKV